MTHKYIFKIDGMPKDTTYNSLPFGRQLDHRNAIEAFKASAETIHYSAKHTTTKKGFQDFKKLYLPTQWFLVDKDGPYYHDDSFQVWFTRKAKVQSHA